MVGLPRNPRGSGLIIALSVLAMLAVMATSYITLMRLDTRVTRNYLDDQHCEMLAHGMLNYFKSILRDDLDRTWGKYENRDMAVGGCYTWGNDRWVNIPGRVGYAWGTAVSNDFWYAAPISVWGDWGGLYDYNSIWGTLTQDSFIWSDYYNRQHAVIGRYYDAPGDREIDVFIDRIRNCRTSDGRVVDETHPQAGPGIDDDGDGTPNPSWTTDDWYWSPYGEEQNSDSRQYYDLAPTIIFGGNQPMFPGCPFTGEAALQSGVYWRWAVHLGYGHSMYLNLNTAGNLDRPDTALLQNIGGLGLAAGPALDERESGGRHLGRLEWKGYSGEHHFQSGFPTNYDAVAYQPSQVNLERLFSRPPGAIVDLNINRAKAQAIIRSRWGDDGKPADGTDKWRPGWRPDGATYYKLPSPENPVGNDRYLGVDEVMEHDHAVYHPSTSRIASILTDVEQRKIRPFTTYWSTDTILRGKIWPTEGPPYTARQGDWRHIDILKRVNINIIGAKTAGNLPGEDGPLKQQWAAKSTRERTRLYYMLVAAMEFTSTPDASQKACQFIASLADMVDPDREETYYEAPTGGVWALGVEKHPVLNEVVFYARNADTANYELAHLRVELCNPMENIPWIPDAAEAIDIRDYQLKVNDHTWRLGDMDWFAWDDFSTRHGKVTSIGADGMYGNPSDGTLNKQSWSRYLHIGWDTDFPAEVTKEEMVSGLTIELWKPLAGDAAARVPLSASRVAIVGGNKCICVDRTPLLRLMPPLEPGQGPGAKEKLYTGCYRRWDPMNAHIFGTVGRDEQSNVVWCPGWGPAIYATLGRPNTDYPARATVIPYSAWDRQSFSEYKYRRQFERNFKVVDGDLPSIGWLGELVMRNCAQDGPLTLMHAQPQNPQPTDARYPSQNELDARAKFDLFRPFRPLNSQGINVTNPSPFNWPTSDEVANAVGAKAHPENLHMLDMFTVWDPSNDGIDNDGDGAIDDEDTGYQVADRGGPEVRVFGRVDLNYAANNTFLAVFPDSSQIRTDYMIGHIGMGIASARQKERNRRLSDNYEYSSFWGPFETIGDLLRTDGYDVVPGSYLGGGSIWEALVDGQWRVDYVETGLSRNDDDGDGIANERDERDMFFTWVSNYFTTRANVFEINLNVDLCETPYYPDRKLPMEAYKCRRRFARKQLMGILDRSVTLRIQPGGACDFSGPVDVRMLRFSDDLRVY